MTSRKPKNARDAARDYLQRGWSPIPVQPKSKVPVGKGWPKIRLTEQDLPDRFPKDANIGIILGDASGGLVDIDLDCPEALELADALLPSTKAIFGRKSAPKSHRLYQCTTPGKTKRFEDIDGQVLLEVRSNGHQICAHL